MKELLLFLQKCILFLACGLLFIWLSYSVNTYFFDAAHQKYYSNYTTLILGDSHVRNLNTKIIKNSLNLSEQAGTYKVAYYRLKYFSNINDLEHVILAHSYHNLAYPVEYRIKDSYHSSYRIYPIVSPFTLFQSTNSLENFWKIASKYVFSINLTYIGDYFGMGDFSAKAPIIPPQFPMLDQKQLSASYQASRFSQIAVDSLLIPIEKRIKGHFGGRKTGPKMSESSLDYLQQIAALCQTRHIQLHLLTTPLSPLYRERIPIEHQLNFETSTDQLVNQYHVKAINLEAYFDQQQDLMYDQDHINRFGSGLISELLVSTHLLTSE